MESFGNIQLYHGDCMHILYKLEDNSFDLAIVDSPYFSGPERRQFYGRSISTSNIRRVNYPVSIHWKVHGPEYFRELERVAKHYIVWGCNYFDYHFASGRIVWDKCNGSDGVYLTHILEAEALRLRVITLDFHFLELNLTNNITMAQECACYSIKGN